MNHLQCLHLFTFLSLTEKPTDYFDKLNTQDSPRGLALNERVKKKQIEMHTLKYVNVRGAKEESKLKQ